MSIHSSITLQKLRKLIGQFRYDPSESAIDFHDVMDMRDIGSILKLSSSMPFAIDYRNYSYAYLGENCEWLTGYKHRKMLEAGPYGLLSEIVPQKSVECVAALFHYILSALKTLPPEELTGCKITCTFPISHKSGKTIMLLQSGEIILANHFSEPIFELGIWADASYWSKSPLPYCFIVNPKKSYALITKYDRRLKKMKNLGISNKEAVVLKKMVKGTSAEEIASSLSIKVNTLKTHRRNMLKKMDVANMDELIHLAWNSGFLDIYPD